MTLASLIGLAVKSLLLAILVLVLLYLLKHRSSAERSLVAHAGLVALLVLPLLAAVGSDLPVELPGPRAAFAPSNVMSDPGRVATLTSITEGKEVQNWLDQGWLLALYAVPALALLLLTLLAVGRLHLLRGRATVMVEPKWLAALAHAQRRIGIKNGTALLGSHEIASPVSWGIWRPVILLSEDAIADLGEVEPIIAHELAHVAHLDWAKLLAGRIVTAMYWFNPFVWTLARHCHQLREEAADDAVLSNGVQGADYAALLLGAARHDNRGLVLGANGVAIGHDSIQRRIARVLDATALRQRPKAYWSALAGLGAMAIAALISALTFVSSVGSPTITMLYLHGDANVRLVYGERARVTLVSGTTKRTTIRREGNKLVILACARKCAGYRPVVEVVTPAITQVVVRSGGAVQSAEGFPAQERLGASVRNGGVIRLDDLNAAKTVARIEGGGTIKLAATDTLDARVRGDGSIIYWGRPEITSSVSGRGVIISALDD